MKYWMWVVFVAILTFLAMEFLVIPLWMIIAIALPLLTILLVIGSVYYNFRESLQLQEVPRHGYGARLKELDREAGKLETLGFRKITEFYLKAIPDSVTYVFKHDKEPFYFCIYHLGQKYSCDIVTRFEDNYYLTTCDSVDGGMAPRPKKSLLQIFPNQSFSEFVERHREGVAYMEQSGIRLFDLAEMEFRHFFIKNYREHADYMKKLFFWPVALIIRTITKPGRVFCNPIKKQYPEGIPRF